tara:strand:+ start:4017 stop:4937 length:921 start_codon:yes stop_codon:yes gene_type:complete
MERKLRFIVCGWWFDEFDNKKGQTSFIEELKEFSDKNDFVDVFWTCHKTPPSIVKDNFNWKEFPNLGLEWGGYDQGWRHIQKSNELESFNDNDIIFFMQDDILIHDWSFVKKCIDLIESGAKVIGNGANYPLYFNPLDIPPISKNWIDPNKRWIDYIREDNHDLIQGPLQSISVRGSFVCLTHESMTAIGGFDYVDTPLPNHALRTVSKGSPDAHKHNLMVYDKTKVPTDINVIEKLQLTNGFGNTTMYLNAYKFTKVLGAHKFKYLSDTYRKSPYMTECGNGMVELPQEGGRTIRIPINESFIAK